MILALNGALITLMALFYGLASSDTFLIAAAFVMAGASYVVNFLDEINHSGDGRAFVCALTLISGVVTYGYLLVKLTS
jgi:hypothetical protein